MCVYVHVCVHKRAYAHANVGVQRVRAPVRELACVRAGRDVRVHMRASAFACVRVQACVQANVDAEGYRRV